MSTDVSTRAVDPAYVTAAPVNPAGLPTAYEHGNRLTPEGASVDRAVRGRRPVCFDPEQGYVDTPVIWRTDLGAGDTFTGPAIVEEFGSTIPVHPGFEVVVDDWANLVIRKESGR